MVKVASAVDTRTRILDEATRLFADEGFEAVSLRQITAEAGVNLAAVNYHFGSKGGLIEEVICRVVEPVNLERLRILTDAEVAASGEPLEVEVIVAAFIRPIFDLAAKNGAGHVFFRLLGRCLSETGENLSNVILRQFKQIAERFSAAFGKSLSDLQVESVHIRLMFTAGVVVHSVMNIDKFSVVSESLGADLKNVQMDEMFAEMVAYAAAGFRSNQK